MRLSILAIGRMKNGPDLDLLTRYVDRASKAGGNLHLHGPLITEFAEDRAQTVAERKNAEASTLLAAIPNGAYVIALDETGKSITSTDFAGQLQALRDDGVGDLAFALGGPDGHGDAILSRADRKLALGKMTWPHQIARIMLAEQIYRAMTILSGHPYHRE